MLFYFPMLFPHMIMDVCRDVLFFPFTSWRLQIEHTNSKFAAHHSPEHWRASYSLDRMNDVILAGLQASSLPLSDAPGTLFKAVWTGGARSWDWAVLQGNLNASGSHPTPQIQGRSPPLQIIYKQPPKK